MYIMHIEHNSDSSLIGWFKDIKINKNVMPSESRDSNPRIKPIITDINKCKTWKTKDGAVKYAKTLAERLEFIDVKPGYTAFKRTKKLLYTIAVYDLSTKEKIYEIRPHFTPVG